METRAGRSLTRRNRLFFGLLVLTTSGVSSRSLAQNASQWRLGPINPAFQHRQQEALSAFGRALPNYGVRPGPLALPPMKSSDLLPDALAASVLPATYDLRTMGRLSPVGNQGQCGCCWAFATMGSLESCLLPDQLCSFSENNLKDTHGFDYGWNDGGNRDMATAYFARWSGPVNSTDDPYNPYSGVSPANLAPRKHVQEALYLPDRSNANDNNVIKQAVMNYGAVMTYFYMDESLLTQSGGNTTYYSPAGNAVNHGVDIVGWDDTFDKSRFKTPAPGNGAFICRNSWGASFGQGGYFYVSYYDKWTGKGGGNTVFNNAEATGNYKQIYQYDPLGCVESLGFANVNDLWFSNIFTAISADNVAAVSFYTLAPNTTYKVNVYSNAANGPITAGGAHTTDTGVFSLPGYHTVALSNPITLTAQQKFSVVVEVSANATSLVPVQCQIPGYTSKATATAGHGYVSVDGKSWSDVTVTQANMSVCLKAFTQNGPPTVATPTFSPDGGAYNTAQNVTINCATSGATLHYTTNGNDPTEADPIPGGPITVSQTLTLKAKAWYPGDTPSAVKAGAYTIAPYTTAIVVAATTGSYGQTVTLKAALTSGSSASPLSGRTLTFQLVGATGTTTVGTGVTNDKGIAACSYQIANSLIPGANPISVTYAGESGYKAATGSGILTVTRAGISLITGNAAGKPGAQVSLQARLIRATDNTPLVNKTLSFTLSNGTVVTATTNASGVATVSYTIPPTAVAGNLSYGVAFAGDATSSAGNAIGAITINSK